MKGPIPAGSAASAAVDPSVDQGRSVPAPPVEPRFAPYVTEIATAQERLDTFMAAFNARDPQVFETTFNFPHVRFASGKVTVINPGHYTPEMFSRGALAEWDHSAWQRREVIHAGPDKVHLDTQFARYRRDDSLIGGFDSIYIVTRVDGRWGIQARSSFAP